MADRSSIRTVLRYLRQAAIIGVITIVIGEVALRIYNAIHPLPIFYSTSYNRFRARPFSPDYGDFRLNSKGFKDVEHSPRKADGTFRVLGVGDSFVYSVVPYENNFMTLVEAGLNRHGRNAEVVNMGIPGTGPRDYLSMLFQEGLALAPDLVVVSFFIGNDFEKRAFWRRLHQYSYVASAIKFIIDFRIGFRGYVFGSGTYDDNAGIYTEDAYLKLEALRSQIYRRDNRAFDHDLADAMAPLAEIKSLCDRHRMRLLVVIIPDELQVDRALQKKVIGALGSTEQALDFARPNRALTAMLTRRGIDHLDLLEVFSAAAGRERLYRPNDSHWNIRGNELAAEAILRKLSGPVAPAN